VVILLRVNSNYCKFCKNTLLNPQEILKEAHKDCEFEINKFYDYNSDLIKFKDLMIKTQGDSVITIGTDSLFHYSWTLIPINEISLLEKITLRDLNFFPDYFWRVLSNIKQLHLSNCSFNDNNIIQIQRIKQLKNLENLIITVSTGVLPDVIFELVYLKELTISGRCIEFISEKICNLSNLTYLSIRGTSIRNLPSEISHLTKLEKINFMENPFLSNLPNSLINLINLRAIAISYSGFSAFPDILFQFDFLTELYIGGININFQTLEKIFAVFSVLKVIVLNRCNIVEIPDNISLCSKLESIDVSDNKLHKMPKTISNLRNLSELDLVGNLF
jgi:Leucine-rich repeat (LRR) protein